MFRAISNVFRSIALLRHPEVRTVLGNIRLRQMELAAIRLSHPDAKLADDIECIAYNPERMILGERVTLCRGTILAFGDDQNGFGNISIGSDTWIGQYNNIRACRDGNIDIGAYCLISQFCTLVGSNHAIARGTPIMQQGPDRTRLGITIGDDVWLSAGVVVAPGVTIGNGAVIGANSVVTHNVPAYEIWAGCPARKIDERK